MMEKKHFFTKNILKQIEQYLETKEWMEIQQKFPDGSPKEWIEEYRKIFPLFETNNIDFSQLKELSELSMEELEGIDCQLLDSEERTLLKQNVNVKSIEVLGTSGKHPNMMWYTVTLTNGKQVDIYG